MLPLSDGSRNSWVQDYDLKKLTRPGDNYAGFMDKNVRICGSGVYRYHRSELRDMGLGEPPSEHRDLDWFGVYRPAAVLTENKDMFARIPITVEHPDEMLNLDNADKYVKGLTGDSVEAETAKDGETYLYTTLTLFSKDAVSFYKKEGREVSCGYMPTLEWKGGEHNGRKYQITMTGLRDGNHLALCKSARGGRQIKVLDKSPAIAGKERYLKGVRYKAMFLASGVKDASTKFKMVLDSVDAGEKIGEAVDFALTLVKGVKDSEKKQELMEELQEFKGLDSLDPKDWTPVRDYLRDAGVALLTDSGEGDKVDDAKEPPKKEEKEDEKKDEAKDAHVKGCRCEACLKAAKDAQDPNKVLAAIIGDAVKTGVAEALKGLALDKASAPAKDKEAPKKEEQHITMSLTDMQPKTGGFSIDSIMRELTGIKKEEAK